MEKYTVMVMPSTTRTRILVTHGPDELLRAIFPPPSQIRHERSVPHFLAGLSLLLDSSLRVVLCVDAPEVGFCLGLTDEMGLGERSLYYRVEVVERNTRRRRGRRIRGVGDFADLRQLQLRLVVDRGEP
jgi:hypothetical protein